MKDDKKTWALSILGVIALLGAVVGATYAYFSAQGGDAETENVNVTASTTDSLIFQKGTDISLNITQNNFSNTKGSSSMESFVKATLTANNKTNEATDNYYVYLDITENGINYTTEEMTPELVLTVTDSEGNAVVVSGLTEVTVTDRTGATITGYDITGKEDLITILDNKEIAVDTTNAEHKTEESYNIKITMVNLDKDQTANANKNFVSQIMIQKDKILTIANTCTGQNFASCIANNYTVDKSIYYHDGVGTYGEFEAEDYSYRYTGANPKNYVCLGSAEAICPEDNLYRIIGVFGNQLKLIKNTFINFPVHWDENNKNVWSTSNVKTTLNETYYTELDEITKSLIAETTWIVSGNTNEKIMETIGVKNVYKNEITNPATDAPDNKTEDTFKVGLMYVSDYMYAADPTKNDAWSNLQGYNESDASKDFRSVKDYNWFIKTTEYTITRSSNTTNNVFRVYYDGYVKNYSGVRPAPARPCFYLNSNVVLTSGTGSVSSPFRVALS